MPRAGQHNWTQEPDRRQFHTDRACYACGLVKRTRHDGPGRPWIEFYRDGAKLDVKATPPCPGPPDQSTIDFSPPRNTMTNGDAHEAHH